MSPRERKRPSGTATNTALTPSTEPLRVGDSGATGDVGKPARRVGKPAGKSTSEPVGKPARVPFGTYLPPELQREFKARCVLLGIEMQDGTEQAIRDWLERNPA
ncbi:hypothetical protein [Streptomyces antarcticus]|uniref:hypothetical protein n=1 Tax=Streptomyces antarcticus TaxID=2996458 RepID=UPI00227107A5|nr:hypothetical protein [Streptomyces sp. H34-AA3]MCY0947861.1 hypothetical protein [Streptomyces sp. H34-AA3]